MIQKYEMEDIRNCVSNFEKLKDDQLATIAFPAIDKYLTREGYASGNPLERIRSWIEEELPKLCKLAKEEAKNLRDTLNDDRVRSDTALIAVVAAALAKLLGAEGVPIEEIAALALLAVRYYPGKTL